MTKLKLMAVAIAMVTMSGCAGVKATYSVMNDTPTVEECKKVREIGMSANKADPKVEAAQEATLSAGIFHPILSKISLFLGGARELGKNGYEVVHKKYIEKCVG